jgi:hypothetical protein
VKGRSRAGDNARQVRQAFERWPTWIWANEEVVELAEWRPHAPAVAPLPAPRSNRRTALHPPRVDALAEPGSLWSA